MSPPHARLWAAIPAGGVGSRFGGDRPKQYVELLGRPLIHWSLQPFLDRDDIAGIAVAVGPGDGWWQACRPESDRVRATEAGRTRAASVLAALAALAEEGEPQDWVLVHDAVRPCLHPADLERLVSDVRAHGVGGLLAAAVTDTIKRAADGVVIETVTRDDLWRALTPQMFPLGVLQDALRAARLDRVPVTDEAAAMERAGYHPRLVPGRIDNIKITRPEDLAVAAAVLTARSALR
jgi:2-C-methyl-D-erythritol 4-phosphate cytidylyltransferase